MSSLLHRLGSNEAVLLMYLADELPREDRAEVEQMLAADASLRAELERLREVNDLLATAISADAGMSRAANETAVRRVMREMKRHQVQLSLRPSPVRHAPRRQIPGWAYPLAAVAALLVIVIGMWGVGIIDFAPIPGRGDRMVADYGDYRPDDDDSTGIDLSEPDRLQLVMMDEVGEYFDEASVHVEQLMHMQADDADDALLLMKDPA